MPRTRRSLGGATRRRSAPRRTATPAEPQPEPDFDDDVDDADESRVETPVQNEDEDDGDAEEPEAEVEEAQASDAQSSPPVVQPFPRKKRIGRPPKNPPPDYWNTPEPDGAGSEAGTPFRKKRGRPAGGGRGGRVRGGPSHTTKVPIDKEGNMMDVVDDEVQLPEDADGEQKVDKLGFLQGGREYRVRTFTILGRGDRLYMLSTEPARCTGFRDSYLFFAKHMQLFKIIVNDDEKKDLITRDLIPHSYKGRAIGVVTARSVFREFGARIIVGGKKVTDDYYGQAVLDQGGVEGEVADPHDHLPGPGEAYNRNQYVAWHGASAVYHTSGPSVPLQNGKPAGGKRKIPINSANWMFEHARSAARFNSALTYARRTNAQGVYDAHTNAMWQPQILQPTHAKWEAVPQDPTADEKLTNDAGRAANGDGPVDLEPKEKTSFAPVPPVVARNFLIVDTVFEAPQMTGLGIPGPDGDYMDVGVNGLPDLDEEDLAEMPPECRIAFQEAKAKQQSWSNKWQTESKDGSRASLKIGFSGVPV